MQRAVLHRNPEGGGLDCFCQVQRGPRSWREAIVALDAVFEELKSQPNLSRFWFHRHATGSDATQRWMTFLAGLLAARGEYEDMCASGSTGHPVRTVAQHSFNFQTCRTPEPS